MVVWVYEVRDDDVGSAPASLCVNVWDEQESNTYDLLGCLDHRMQNFPVKCLSILGLYSRQYAVNSASVMRTLGCRLIFGLLRRGADVLFLCPTGVGRFPAHFLKSIISSLILLVMRHKLFPWHQAGEAPLLGLSYHSHGSGPQWWWS